MWLCAFCASIVYCVLVLVYLWCVLCTEMLVLVVPCLEVRSASLRHVYPLDQLAPPTSGCQIFATRSSTELEAVIAPGHLVLSLCVCCLIAMVTESHATGYLFALIGRASSLYQFM